MDKKSIDLDEYGRRIFKAKDSPGTLDSINTELMGWYAYFNEQLNSLELLEAKFWQDNKKIEGKKDRSDKELEGMWKLTDDGEYHMRSLRAVKTIEKLSSSLKSSLRRAEVESRGQF
jgi:hypothetical protein